MAYNNFLLLVFGTGIMKHGWTWRDRVPLEHAPYRKQTSTANRSMIRVHGNRGWTNARRLFSFPDRRNCLFPLVSRYLPKKMLFFHQSETSNIYFVAHTHTQTHVQTSDVSSRVTNRRVLDLLKFAETNFLQIKRLGLSFILSNVENLFRISLLLSLYFLFIFVSGISYVSLCVLN